MFKEEGNLNRPNSKLLRTPFEGEGGSIELVIFQLVPDPELCWLLYFFFRKQHVHPGSQYPPIMMLCFFIWAPAFETLDQSLFLWTADSCFCIWEPAYFGMGLVFFWAPAVPTLDPKWSSGDFFSFVFARVATQYPRCSSDDFCFFI